MAESPHIVIAGGGAIGLSVACHLGLAGARNVTLLEKNRLTSGSSWHAAGIVGPLRSSQNLTQLASYGIGLFDRLEKLTGLSTAYQQTGGLWLAQQDARLVELERIAAMGLLNDLDAQMLTPAQTAERVPILHCDDLAGALWVEQDGQINPVDLCMVYAKAARDHGVIIREHAAVSDIASRDGVLSSVTVNGDQQLRCDIFINCAGVWARELGLRAGVNIPLQAVEHSYLVSEAIDALTNPCPIVRDLDSGFYFKGDAGKLVFGCFERNAKLWQPDSVDASADYLLFAEDWDHHAPLLDAMLQRVPLMSDTGIQQYICGPEAFTLDTRQLMGESAELRNYFVAAGFNSIGIMSSAGAGWVMAQWVMSGRAPMDLWDVDIQRFAASDNQPVLLQSRIPESVYNQFALHWPGKQFETGRNRKRSAWHSAMASRGAVFGAPTGWERPLWYADGSPPTYSYAAQPWWPYARAESLALMQYGALFDLSPMSKLQISGADALAFLQYCCTRDMNIKPGQIVYTLMLNSHAGIEMECTVCRLSSDSFMLVSGAASRTRDRAYLQRQIKPGQQVRLEDLSDNIAVLGLAGPRAGQCLSQLCGHATDADSFAFSTQQTLEIAGCQLRAARLSYSGEAGWELYIDRSEAAEVFEHIHAAASALDMVLAGHYCLDSCRLEKAYAHWGHDIGTHDTPQQAGLMFAVELNKKSAFRGRQALQQALQSPPQRQRVLLQLDCSQTLLLHDEPVYRNGRMVGMTTSGGPGFRTGLALSMAMVSTDDDGNIDGDYQLLLGQQKYPATLLHKPAYDPGGLLPRC